MQVLKQFNTTSLKCIKHNPLFPIFCLSEVVSQQEGKKEGKGGEKGKKIRGMGENGRGKGGGGGRKVGKKGGKKWRSGIELKKIRGSVIRTTATTKK